MWNFSLNPDSRTFKLEFDGKTVFAKLEFALETAEEEICFSQWRQNGCHEFSSAFKSGKLLLRTEDVNGYIELTPSVQVSDSFHWKAFKFRKITSHDDWGMVPGEQLRLFTDGWTMVTSAASHRYGDKDFGCNPDYVQFCRPTVSDYDVENTNHFHGEYVAVLNNSRTGDCLLTAFTTSGDQINCFDIRFAENGLAAFEARLYGDNALAEPEDTLKLETLTVMTGNDAHALLDSYASRWGESMHARKWDHVPNGWCSWYYYFYKVTQKDIEENVSYLKEHRKEYPLEYIQIDDGYQAALGDWLTTKQEFPNGLPHLAKLIKDAGFKPGLWLAPFCVEERSQLFQQHPDWMVHDKDGNVPFVSQWRGINEAVLDGTNPEVQNYFRTLFASLAEFGFEYVKLDFMAYALAVQDGKYYDPKATRAQALRRGLAAIRQGFGEDRFILGCTVPLGPVIGLVNAERIGTDITPCWGNESDAGFRESPMVPHVCRNIINRCYLHKKLWCNDPDVHIARIDNNKLTEEEVRLWTSALWLAGGLTLLTDRFSTLDPDRAALSKLLLEESDAFEHTRPLDLFEREFPAVWQAKKRSTGKTVYGCFNFGREPLSLTVPVNAEHFTEFWTKEQVSAADGKLTVEIPPHCARLFFE